MSQGQWVIHTQQVLNRLEVFSAHINTLANSRNNYLVSIQDEYRKQYKIEEDRSIALLAEIKDLTADNTAQQAKIAELNKSLNAEFSEMASMFERHAPVDPDAPSTAPLSTDVSLFDNINTSIAQMKIEEVRLLDLRMQAWHAAMERTRLIFMCGIIGFASLMIVAYAAINRQMLTRERLLKVEKQATIVQRDLANRLSQIVGIQRDIVYQRLNLNAAMEAITDRTREITNADSSIIEMLEKDEMVYRAASANSREYVGLRLKAATSLSGRCVIENQTMYCTDSELDDRVDKEACKKVGLRSMIVVPLVYESVAIGVLKVTSAQPEAFTPEDIGTLEMMAGMLSATIKDASETEAIHIANNQLTRVNAQLENLAITDGLTGLKNHRYFKERLAEECSRALRHGMPLSVVLLDADHFKKFNDTYGHSAGDKVLQTISNLLKESARSIDCVARYGGEEFALILPQTDLNGALVVAERIRVSIAATSWENTPITVSIGVSSMDARNKTPDIIIDLADKALYASKAAGRNCVTPMAA